MVQNYLLLIIIILTVLFKALADGYNYLFDTAKNDDLKKKYGTVYHIFGVFAIGVPMMSVVLGFLPKDLWLIISGFAFIYFGIFDAIYNRVTKKPIYYIGKTDFIDRLLGRIFDQSPTMRGVLVTIRWAFFIFGMAIILDLITQLDIWTRQVLSIIL